MLAELRLVVLISTIVCLFQNKYTIIMTHMIMAHHNTVDFILRDNDKIDVTIIHMIVINDSDCLKVPCILISKDYIPANEYN